LRPDGGYDVDAGATMRPPQSGDIRSSATWVGKQRYNVASYSTGAANHERSYGVIT
jgi:hypothetical protein